MIRCFVLLIALLLYCELMAQKQSSNEKPLAKPPQFGKVTTEELQMKECSFEKDAPAVKLVHYESVEFTMSPYGDLRLVTETTCRIKIFNKNGFKNASIIIPYTGRTRTSRITDVTAKTYNLDDQGKAAVTEVSRKDIFRDVASEKNGLSTVRFTFPNVKEGSVIEYRFTRIEKNSYFISPWFFQSDIPTQFSACKVATPSLAILQKHLVAMSDVEEGYHRNTKDNMYYDVIERSYCMREVPSFKVEPFMTPLKDNLQRVDFVMLPGMSMFGLLFGSKVTWSMFNQVFLRSPFFGEQFTAQIPGTEKFVDSVKLFDSTRDKINAVYQYVKKQITWDHHYSFYADNLADVWKERQGNSAEINLSILNLLRKVNVSCYPIVFSTRDNGRVDMNFPSLSQLNSMDVLAISNDSTFILDGSERYLSFHTTPSNILNREAFIVDNENNQWVTIDNTRPLIKDSISIVAALDDDGVLRGQASITYFDFSKASRIEQDNQHDDETEDDNLITDKPDLQIDSSYQLNKNDELLPLQEVLQFHYELPSSGDFHFLNPFLLSSFRKNPFTDTSRQTDIDFGANSSYILHMEISLPKKLRVEELIKNRTIRTTDTSLLFTRTNELVNDKLVINSQFSINQAIFEKEAYSGVESFFKTVYTFLNEQLLLKKKEE